MSVSLLKDPIMPRNLTPEVTPFENPGLADKRETMPRGGYVFGRSNAALRPEVPKGQ